jgi:hypothetical protein
MKSTEKLSSAELVSKTPEEYDLVILGGDIGSTIAAWRFANRAGVRSRPARQPPISKH